jgi:methylenetetrahydrofolate dehydrogenase (NADP+)/methenyltetrahydrofolate cyclohydrolase
MNKGLHSDRHEPFFMPCTALGIIRLLNFYSINLKSKHVLMIGRSAIVGKPLALECLHRDATITIAHSGTTHLNHLIQQADIIISATGNLNVVQWSELTASQILIDVGMHRQLTELTGDLGPKPIDKNIAAYTPVPGGVGPMTVNSLMYNIFKAYCLQNHHRALWAETADAIEALTL